MALHVARRSHITRSDCQYIEISPDACEKPRRFAERDRGGQMLICVGVRGYYQEWGKAARELHPGDIVNIPANVKHWHGAAHDS